jgi:hypothetical protein
MQINYLWIRDQVSDANREWVFGEGTKERDGLDTTCHVLGIDPRAVIGAYRLYKRFYARNPFSKTVEVFEKFLDLLDYHNPKVGMPTSAGFPDRKLKGALKSNIRTCRDLNGYRYHKVFGLMRNSIENWVKLDRGSGFIPSP